MGLGVDARSRGAEAADLGAEVPDLDSGVTDLAVGIPDLEFKVRWSRHICNEVRAPSMRS